MYSAIMDYARPQLRRGNPTKKRPPVNGWPAAGRSRPAAIRRTTDWDQQMEQAARLKDQLLPGPRAWPGLEVAFSSEPFLAVGGDYVDVLPMPDGRVLVALGDVCGKGLPAALVATAIHGVIHHGVAEGHDVDAVVQKLDGYLRKSWPEGPFVTLACVAIDPVTGATESVNAGHPPVLLGNPFGMVRPLKSGETLPLGIGPLEPHAARDTMAPGQILLLYSDGWTDLLGPSGQVLGVEGFTECWRSACCATRGADLDRTLRVLKVRTAAVQHGTRAIDDRSLLLVRRWE